MKMVTVEVMFGVEDDYDTSALDEVVEGGLDILAQSDDEQLVGILEYGAVIKGETTTHG